MPRRRSSRRTKEKEVVLPFSVADSARFDELVNAPGELDAQEELEVRRAWECGANVKELKARLKEMDIKWDKNATKSQLVGLLIEKHVPLGGGPIVWVPDVDTHGMPQIADEEPSVINSSNGEPITFKQLADQVKENARSQAETRDTLQQVLEMVTGLSERQQRKRPASPGSDFEPRLRKQRTPMYLDEHKRNLGYEVNERTQSLQRANEGKHSDFGLIRVNAQIRDLFKSALYVDLRSLRETSVVENEFVELGSGVCLQVNGRTSKAPIVTIAEWTVLFTRLVQGVADFHPHMVPMMFEHMTYINGAAHRDAYPVERLIEYSQAMRKKYQGPHADWSTHDVGLMGLYLQQQSKPTARGRVLNTTKPRRENNKAAKSKSPKFCFDWEFSKKCKFGANCRFAHSCLRCKGGSKEHTNANCPNPMSGNE